MMRGARAKTVVRNWCGCSFGEVVGSLSGGRVSGGDSEMIVLVTIMDILF